MHNNIHISNMQSKDIDHAVNLWVKQYRLHCSKEEFPKYWTKSTNEVKAVLESQVSDNAIIVAKRDEEIVGFLGYFTFDFHNEKSALCNITSHAAKEEHKEQIYLALYKYASKLWIKENIFNHLWQFFFMDERLKLFLYDLGFGSYVLDAYSKPTVLNVGIEYPHLIRLATQGDLVQLKQLVDESNCYYKAEPLFLKRNCISSDELTELIARNNTFIALDGDKIIGLMNINRADENSTEDLSITNCGLINELGAYIKPEYRGNMLGVHLLNAVMDYCKINAIDLIHVDFETANPFANKFWRKFFTPMFLSSRRTVNKDANV